MGRRLRRFLWIWSELRSEGWGDRNGRRWRWRLLKEEWVRKRESVRHFE